MLDSKTTHLVLQALILGEDPRSVAQRFGLSPSDVAQCLESSGEEITPAARRQMALLRIDKLQSAMLDQVHDPVDPESARMAVREYVRLQDRESKLVGLDAAQKSETDVRVTLSWLQPGRLAYRETKELAQDIRAKTEGSKIEGPRPLGNDLSPMPLVQNGTSSDS